MRLPIALCLLNFLLLESVQRQDLGPTGSANNIDVLHYDFTITIPDTGAWIQGKARISFCRNEPVQSVAFNLVGLHVDSVQIDRAPSDFVYDGLRLTLPLSPTVNSVRDTLIAYVAYNGVVRDGLTIQQDDRGRWTAFGDNWPERARFWIPCVDRPDDKATVTWNIIAPSDRQVVANGSLVRRIPFDSTSGNNHFSLTVWNESEPISPYLMVVAVAPLTRFDLPSAVRGLGGFAEVVEQSVYVEPEFLNYLPGPFKYADDIAAYFSRLIAPFPYEKLAHVQSSTRYGGMENASAIFYPSDDFEKRTLSPAVIAHETAHQWFGDAVTESKWSHLWLSEGFATYFEELWTQYEFGDSAFKVEMSHTRYEILRSGVTRERPIIDTLQTDLMALLDVNSYLKGAWVLHMLRSMLGDSVFFAGIHSYYEKYRNSCALSEDLEREFELQAHEDLHWFFDEWLRRPGYINLSTTWSYEPNSGKVQLTLQQTGPFPPYRFQLTAELVSHSGTRFRERIDIPARDSVKVTINATPNEEPREIVLDPDVQLLAKITSR